MAEEVLAIGLMSGTSMDGIDAALIKTDGHSVLWRGPWLTKPLDANLKNRIRQAMHGNLTCHEIPDLENDITREHIEVVEELLSQSGNKHSDIDVIGFHGQTILHRPDHDITWQLGNGSLMAASLKIDTVCDFRRKDIAKHGEGAPLVPLYHASLAKDMQLPVAILNIGGISNVTWIGRSEYVKDRLTAHDIIAFDVGPGNALLDDWMVEHTDKSFDENGELAKSGKIHYDIADKYLDNQFFKKHPPKSLDRGDFSLDYVKDLSPEDGAATLAYLTAKTAALAAKHFPAPANIWLVTGGGRLNDAVMAHLREMIGNVEPVEHVGWEGDAMEAQAFAFLAVRAKLGLPITLPTTTGTNREVTGGALYRWD